MGERVHVRTVRAQPAESAGNEGVRIDYAKSDVNSTFPTFEKLAAWFRYKKAEAARLFEPALAMIRREFVICFRSVGGWRQFGFAIGMMCVLGALGGAISSPRSDAGIWMGIGGLLIGLTVRVARTKD